MAPFRFGPQDPTTILDEHSLWRATLTPQGPGTVHISDLKGTPCAEFFGPGGSWLEERWRGVLGSHDHVPVITAHHDSVRRAQQQFGDLRLGRSATPYHEIIPAILGQRVTAQEAVRQWKTIVMRHGQQAPGPHPRLMLPPAPDVVSHIPYTTFHTYGIDRRRADTIRHVARVSHFLIRDWPTEVSPSEHTHALTHLPGIGQWTAAVAGATAFGDSDALAVGDFHLKNTVAWALHGRSRGTDEEMIDSLAPYVGHRYRVTRWLQLMGFRAPARGPRRPIVSITQL